MTRHDPTSKAGWVRWPDSEDGRGFANDGQGGMSAYACWILSDGNPVSVCCDGLTILMQEAEVFVGASGPGEGEYTYEGWHRKANDVPPGYYADAVVMLGSTGGSWYADDGSPFKVTWYDLTDEGRRALMALKGLYGREPDILTFLDT